MAAAGWCTCQLEYTGANCQLCATNYWVPLPLPPRSSCPAPFIRAPLHRCLHPSPIICALSVVCLRTHVTFVPPRPHFACCVYSCARVRVSELPELHVLQRLRHLQGPRCAALSASPVWSCACCLPERRLDLLAPRGFLPVCRARLKGHRKPACVFARPPWSRALAAGFNSFCLLVLPCRLLQLEGQVRVRRRVPAALLLQVLERRKLLQLPRSVCLQIDCHELIDFCVCDCSRLALCCLDWCVGPGIALIACLLSPLCPP